MKVSIIGGSGYAGGELLRLLLSHPDIEVNQATSESHQGEYVYQQHPNLRKQTKMKFTSRQMMEPCDVLFLALPHGETQKNIDTYAQLAPKIVDLSADFRLKDMALYKKYYESDHLAPQWNAKFVYGLPELHREEMKLASYISGVGCNATASIMSLYVGVKYGFIDINQPIFVEIKVGSSEGGASANPGSHHPERSNVVRTFAPYGHRHTAEVMQELGLPNVHLTMTSVDLSGARWPQRMPLSSQDSLKKIFGKPTVNGQNLEPFVRLVKDRRGIYRVPEPKILAGTNYVDVGFDLDPETGHFIGIAAIDNLMKGAAGSAVQAMNIINGFEETAGLGFCGLHPI